MTVTRTVRRGLAAGLAALVLAGGAAGGEPSAGKWFAAASPERGREAFLVCRACHTVEEGAAHTVGPNLWGVVGRPVASAEGYDRYTPALTSFGGVWSPERLHRYLLRPMVVVPGTTMVFPGIPSAEDRADLIAWLARNPVAPLDSGPESAGGPRPHAGAARRPVPSGGLGELVAGEGARETHAYCTACHSERIVAQQGLTRADWEEVLEQMVEEHEMTPIEEPHLARVLGYLATHYGPDRPNFPRR